MINLTDLKYFNVVSQTLHVTRASERLGISQPALSHSLKKLEDDLGVQLLFRTKTGVKLTKSGEKFASQAKELIEKWEAVSENIQSDREVVGGEFKIGCHPSVGIYALPLFLRDLQVKYPRLQVQLRHGLSRQISEDIISWRLDFGIVINPPRHPDLVIKELGKDEVTLWHNPKLNPPDTLIYEPDLVQSKSIVDQLERKKIRFSRKMESSSLDVIRALALSGCGVAVLPTRVVGSQGLKAGLVQFSEESPVFQDRICLIYRAGTQLHASGKAIIQMIAGAGI